MQVGRRRVGFEAVCLNFFGSVVVPLHVGACTSAWCSRSYGPGLVMQVMLIVCGCAKGEERACEGDGFA